MAKRWLKHYNQQEEVDCTISHSVYGFDLRSAILTLSQHYLFNGTNNFIDFSDNFILFNQTINHRCLNVAI